jgi:predicted DNA-binding transcriptional regulator AlpA
MTPNVCQTLSHRETWERMGISRREFYRLKAEGRFDHLEAPLPNRYSIEKVDAWIAGRSVHRLKVSA